MKLKIGDRVKIVSVPDLDELDGVKRIIEMTGTVKELNGLCAGVELDEPWEGSDGDCCYFAYERLEKIKEEETNKRKQFIPGIWQRYFYLDMEETDGESLPTEVNVPTLAIWTGDIRDYGMLVLGNVFRSEEEAFEYKEKLLEKLEKLRNGEV